MRDPPAHPCPCDTTPASPWDDTLPDDAWAAARAAWPPSLAPLFEPGATDAQLDAAEARLGVALPPCVRGLMLACSGAGLPAPRAGIFPAEACLMPVTCWRPPDELLAEGFGWDAATRAAHVVVGCNLAGADYSNPVLLRVPCGCVFGVAENIPEIRWLGRMPRWVATLRVPGCARPHAAYVDPRDGGDGVDAVLASHRFYLRFAAQGLDNSARVARWPGVEGVFRRALEESDDGAAGGGAAAGGVVAGGGRANAPAPGSRNAGEPP